MLYANNFIVTDKDNEETHVIVFSMAKTIVVV